MSLTKQDTKLGNFAEVGTPKPHKSSVKHYELERTSTAYILWYLIKRHKMALLVTGNIILVLNWAVPAWPDILKSLVQ